MSQKARRVWVAGVICVAVSVGLNGVLPKQVSTRAAGGQDSSAPAAGSSETPTTSPSQPAAAGLDPLVYRHVTELRERLRLTYEVDHEAD